VAIARSQLWWKRRAGEEIEWSRPPAVSLKSGEVEAHAKLFSLASCEAHARSGSTARCRALRATCADLPGPQT
jgi:hypothetical protein